MGRVLFSAKAQLPKAEPAINWSEIESRLQEISAPVRAGDISAASATLAHTFADEPPMTCDQPVSNPADPLDMLSLPSDGAVAIASSRHPHNTPGRNRGFRIHQ